MVSETRLREILSIGAEVTAPMLVDMEQRALAFIEQQTTRYFGPVETVEVVLEGNGTFHLRLPNRLEAGPAAVAESQYPGASATALASTEYELRDASNTTYLVRLGGTVWRFGWEYRVSYQHGYAQDAGPPDIEQLLIDLVGFRVAMRGKEGMRSETIGGYSYTRFGEGDLDSIDGAWDTIRAWQPRVVA